MNKYTQNNFNNSAVAQEPSLRSKAITVVVTLSGLVGIVAWAALSI